MGNCQHCGEALMGAVNRCWKCGRPVESRLRPLHPLSPDAPDAAANTDASNNAASNANTAANADAAEGAAGVAPRRVAESPFGASRAMGPAAARYPRHLASFAGAWIAVLLGCIATASMYNVPEAAVIVALLGIGCGLWGMRSRRRRWAAVGIAMCCVALASGGFQALRSWYREANGIDPFAPNTLVDPNVGDVPESPLDRFSE